MGTRHFSINRSHQSEINLKENVVHYMWVLKLEEGVWFAPWSGDPGRTLKEESAMRFASVMNAEIALINARCYRPYVDASIDRISDGLIKDEGE